jgi:hypothetical protein
MASDNAFLTERRREVLEGLTAEEMGIHEGTRREHRAALKRQAKAALSELIEVAESDEIDQTDVFDPDEIFRLLATLLHAKPSAGHYEGEVPGGLVDRDDITDPYTDEFTAYRDRLQLRMAKLVLKYDHDE